MNFKEWITYHPYIDHVEDCLSLNEGQITIMNRLGVQYGKMSLKGLTPSGP